MAPCSRCGVPLHDDARFCSYCGAEAAPARPPVQAGGNFGYEVNPARPFLATQEGKAATSAGAGNLVIGLLVGVLGFVLILVGLTADLSCGVIKALGGQCYALAGYLFVDGAFHILPAILLGWGILAILAGIVTAAKPARA